MNDVNKPTDPNEALDDEWAAALGEQDAGKDQAKTATFDELVEEPHAGSVNMDAILDVPVTLSMEIGRTRINIRNLLQLNQGSVVELDRLAGEPMDVLVNGTLIAQGEVVMVNEKFGLRLTDIISPAERIKRLK
jgi:flagellar motor switch protein FliN/FliY